jgi:putative endopeptidase
MTTTTTTPTPAPPTVVTTTTPPKATPAPPPAPTINNIVTPDGKRKFIDAANMNLAAKPGDNFFEYANGAWLKNTVIPASETGWGSFNELREFNQKALKDICEDLVASSAKHGKGTIKQKVADFYAAGMDEAAIEKAGLAPVKPLLDRVANIKNYVGLLDEIANLYLDGADPLWGVSIDQDDKNTTTIVPKFYQGGIHLPDRDYYFKMDDRTKNIRAAYQLHILSTFKLLGSTDMQAQAAVKDIMRMEEMLAKASMTRVEQRDPEKLYNKMTIAELEKICPQMNWVDFMKKTGITNPYVIIGQPKFLAEINNMLKTVQLDDWKTFLRWSVIKGAMPFLSSAFVNEGFTMTKAMSGQKELQPRWKRVSNMTDGVLGEALGQIYTEQHFKPEAKQRMLTLVENLAKVYDKRIQNLGWMSAETKAKAGQKLSAFIRKIGYPDKWQDYTPLSIDRSKSYFENVLAARRFLYKTVTARLGKPVDKGLWGMTPPTVNAYYNPTMNEIVFPAGILQFPFFDNEADDAVNYGGIGAVIGHEMTHGFDDEGRQFDADGNLKDWWLPEDSKKFDAKAKVVVNQFNSYTVLDTVHVNGNLTLGENLADLGGLSLAYEAFKTYSPQAKKTDTWDGFNADQRFFLSWAQVWRSKLRDETMAQRIVVDPHAPGQYRCNGPLSNMAEFYEVFGVKQGDKMWRPEGERAKVW